MISFEKATLSNGLSVIIHTDKTTPLVAVNVVYKVGSKDEDPQKTGFSHLFEHLMFGGTQNVPLFDEVIQNAGGENNAFTNNDITNFYNLVPAENLESILWLEADRMKGPNFTNKLLETQKKVVIEEFKETCLNEPYGDLWHHLGPMAYSQHHYQWPTIGKEFTHISNATLDDVVDFFRNYYVPNNAIITLAGNIEFREGFDLINKWFGDIPFRSVNRISFGEEPPRTGSVKKTINRKVPLDMITLAFNMCDRLHPDFYAIDLLSDLLGSGRSSRLYRSMVNNSNLCVSVDSFITGTTDPGLFIIEGKASSGESLETINEGFWNEIEKVKNGLLEEKELQKLKNKAESNLIFSETNTLNKAISLGYYAYIDELELINSEVELYQNVTATDICRVANELFTDENLSELRYVNL